jgi:hypothetical protein
VPRSAIAELLDAQQSDDARGPESER